MNIVKDYQWAVSKEKAARALVPSIQLKEYQQDVGSIEQQLKFWINIVLGGAAGGAKSYKNLYIAEPTGNKYTLPFYSPYHHTTTNSWGEAGGAFGRMVNDVLTEYAKLFSPTAGIEFPKSWQGTQPASYSFTFDLLNTIDPSQNIPKNKKFLETIIAANLHEKQSIITQLPPCIYEVTIPGVRYSPVSAITNLTVENVGQVNSIGGENVPDAYRINIQLTELIVESRSIYKEKPKVIGKSGLNLG